MRPLIRFVVIVSTLLATRGCYTEQQYPAYVDDGSADLVEVSPGVEAIADWDAPIFFVDDYYWMFRGRKTSVHGKEHSGLWQVW